MKRINLDAMGTDDLWSLHVKVTELLKQRMQTEKERLEERLEHLDGPSSGHRAYPPVIAKYRNPDQPSETWAGRGKQPRWLVAQLRAGRRVEDFRIKQARNGE